MTRKQSNVLPKHQTVHFDDKAFWEMLRIFASSNDLTISELSELAIKSFMASPESEKIILRHKLNKELGFK